MDKNVYSLEQIADMWEKDSPIDRTNLGEEAAKTQKLHHKYLTILILERLRLHEAHSKLANLKRLKHEYFIGTISEEDRKEHGWPPNPLRIIREDIKLYLEADKDLIEENKRIAICTEKVKALETILNVISFRNNPIRSAIDWEKFQAGIG